MNLIDKLLGRIEEQKRRVVVIGDRMVDRWVHGRTETCQDDCVKFVQECVVEVPGGAANAERSIIKWGVPTWLYSYAQNECPIKTRYVEDGKIVFRADDEGPTNRYSAHWLLHGLALEAVKTSGGVLLSDYDKGFLTPEFIHDVADLCMTHGIPCVADCKRAPDVYAGCILKGNAAYWLNHREQYIKYGGTIVVTYGAISPDIFIEDNRIFSDNPPPVKCINHVGAGDCFAAHLTLALAYGFSLREATAIAHSAGRVYVQHPHNRPPLPTEIAADMEINR